MNISPLPYNGDVSELTWPQVTELKIPRYISCKYWCPHQILKVSYWYLKNCSYSEILNIFEVGSLDLTWWPDLKWPRAEISWKGAKLMYEKVTIWVLLRILGRAQDSDQISLGGERHSFPEVHTVHLSALLLLLLFIYFIFIFIIICQLLLLLSVPDWDSGFSSRATLHV